MMLYFIIFYLGIGLLGALYIFGSHLRASFEYIRQLYTAKKVRPTKIKTYFGTQYWMWFDEDDWTEVIFMTTLPTLLWTLVALVAWPAGSIMVLNTSIQNARKRIENDD
jgi:hypothetical protein